MKRIYLSIDLDFWFSLVFPYLFLEEILSFGKKPYVVLEHHEILKRICNFDEIWNIDEHSDLAEIDDTGVPELIDGTWLNHVKGISHKRLIWFYPTESSVAGSCNANSGGFCNLDPELNPFNGNSLDICGWKEAEYRKGLPVFKGEKIVGIGISLSPIFSRSLHVEQMGKWIRRKKKDLIVARSVREYFNSVIEER